MQQKPRGSAAPPGSTAAAFAATLMAAAAVALCLGGPFVWALALSGVAAGVASVAFARSGGGRFGVSNGVTMLRLGLTASLLAPVLAFGAVQPSWPLVGLVGTLLLLDGLDGWLARRRNESSSFGARFDMEADTALILVTSVLVVAAGRGPAAVLVVGLLRPLFVVAGKLLPWLAAPLPPSLRRKALCVLPIALLGAALAPPLGGPSMMLAWLALALLAGSFALDAIWLATSRLVDQR